MPDGNLRLLQKSNDFATVGHYVGETGISSSFERALICQSDTRLLIAYRDLNLNYPSAKTLDSKQH